MARLAIPGRTLRPGVFTRRRRVPVGTRDFDPPAGGHHGGYDDGGLAGVREPRRPLPTLPTLAAEAELPVTE